MVLMRLSRLPRDRRRTLIRASLSLAAASAAVALLPFRTAIRFGSVALKPRNGVTPEDCVWAVEAAARRLPLRTLCIEKGIAVQRLLRSGGVDAVLHYGARRATNPGGLEAHVWVSVGGKTIIGGEEAAGYAEVAAFP
jgi:hypothetical protein